MVQNHITYNDEGILDVVFYKWSMVSYIWLSQ